MQPTGSSPDTGTQRIGDVHERDPHALMAMPVPGRCGTVLRTAWPAKACRMTVFPDADMCCRCMRERGPAQPGPRSA